MLTLYEELYLLALDEEKGNLVPFARKEIAYPLAGTFLAELSLLGKIDLGEKRRLIICDDTPTGDQLLDRALEQIKSTEKPHKIGYWITLLGEEPKKLRQTIGENLAAKNILVQDEKRFFRPDPGKENVTPVPGKFEMKHRLRSQVLLESGEDVRCLMLLNILLAGDLLGLVFTQDEIGMAGQLIHKQVLTVALRNTAMQLVEEIEQAVCQAREDESD